MMSSMALIVRLVLVRFALDAMTVLDPGRDHLDLAWAAADAIVDHGPLFRGDTTLRKTTGLVVAVAFREGSLRLRVSGDKRNGKYTSFCTMQIHDSSGGTEALNDDPRACFAKGLTMLQASMRECPAHPVAWYAEGPGGCASDRAQHISADRMNLAAHVVRRVEQQERDGGQ